MHVQHAATSTPQFEPYVGKRKAGRPRRAGASGRTIAERNRLVVAHQGLVRRLARNFRERGLEFEDLVSEGQLGLLRAAELFDPERGVTFAAYADRWVRAAMGYAIAARGPMVHVPHRVLRSAAASRRAGCRDDDGPVRGRLRRAGAFDESAFSWRRPNGVTCEAAIRWVDDRDWVETALKTLPEREAAVVRARFGIDEDGRRRALPDVGARFGVCGERARQLTTRAIGRIRAWARASQESDRKNRAHGEDQHDCSQTPRFSDEGGLTMANKKKDKPNAKRNGRFMTQAEVADELGIDRGKLIRWARIGAVGFPRAVRVIGRTYLFSRREIETWALDRAWSEERQVQEG